MTQKLKTIGFAFTGLIMYSALATIMSYIFKNHVIAGLTACILFIILGGAYNVVILGRHEPIRETDTKFLLRALCVVLVYCFTSMTTSTFILKRIDDIGYFEQSAAYAELSLLDSILSMIISIVAAPIAEELAFRGCMYRFLSKLNKPAAMIISSFIFATWHGTIVHMYAAFFGGLLFCIIYDKTSKLRYSVLAHILFNGVTAVISCFRYPVFMTKLWWVLVLNCVFFLLLAWLQSMSGTRGVKYRELTEEEKRDREKTSRIVDEVMNEYKHKH